ncbi:MAG: hypothetical protein IPJ68_03445 [Candidatus Moraniibacteriota bacterium]|nr:MAG: hypothetical protein IPJ68_03445 [Candidatus Moranbacteria bacterium]
MKGSQKFLSIAAIGIFLPQIAFACSRVHAAIALPLGGVLFLLVLMIFSYKIYGKNEKVKRVLSIILLVAIGSFVTSLVLFGYQEYKYRQELFACREKCPVGENCICEPSCL